jgi:TonB-dependent starch-binding outer membrane protein SusC
LRDAEATAIYGAQGANGVVLITTRRGQRGPTQFTATVRAGFQDFAKGYETLSGPEFVEFMMEAAANRAIDLGNDPMLPARMRSTHTATLMK